MNRVNNYLIIMSLFTIISCPIVCSDNDYWLFPNVTYDSLITLDYGKTNLSGFVPLDVSIKIPIYITYSSSIPLENLSIIPSYFLNQFLFGYSSPPQQTLRISIVDPPTWCNVYLDHTQFMVNISGDNTILSMRTNLTLSPSKNAPSESYRMRLKAECDSIKRLQEANSSIWIEFTPEYRPCITISGNTTVNVTAHQQTNVTISVKNCGNKISKIIPRITSDQQHINPRINPQELYLSYNESAAFIISVNQSDNLSAINIIEMNFTSQCYPFRTNASNMTVNHRITFYYQDVDKHETNDSNWIILLIILFSIVILIFGRYKKYW